MIRGNTVFGRVLAILAGGIALFIAYNTLQQMSVGEISITYSRNISLICLGIDGISLIVWGIFVLPPRKDVPSMGLSPLLMVASILFILLSITVTYVEVLETNLGLALLVLNLIGISILLRGLTR